MSIAVSSGDPVQDALAALSAAVDRLAELADPAALPRLEGSRAAAVVTGALAVAGRLSAVAARTIPVVEADGWWSLEGARSITSWVSAQGRVSYGQAARLVGLGRALRDDLPVTAVEAVSGEVSIEAAHILASVTSSPARKQALTASAQDCGEEFLVEHARELTVGRLRVLARRWASHADPEADERGYREASEREFLDLADTTDGWHLAGFLTSENGHALRAALEAMAGRSADQAGQPTARRRATALNAVVRTVLDRDLTGATGDHRPQVTVVTDLATLNRALARDVTDRAMSRPSLRSESTKGPAASPARLARRPTEPGPSADPPDARSAPAHRAGPVRDLTGPGDDRSAAPVNGSTYDPPTGDAPTGNAPTGDPPTVGPAAAGPAAAGADHSAGRAARADACSSDDERSAIEPTSGSRPLATSSDLERFGVAELVGTGPIPDSVLARLACDSQITRVVFGPDSVVLNVGRAERTYAGAKRRAIIARDQRCRFPGCSAPPAMGEVHHIDHWVRDQGETSVHTGILVCWHHHKVIHERGIEVGRSPDGRWRFVDRRGRPLVSVIG